VKAGGAGNASLRRGAAATPAASHPPQPSRVAMKKNTKPAPAGVAYENASDGSSSLVPTVDHPYFMRPGENRLARAKTDAGNDGPTRDEADARLKDFGLSQVEREVFLAKCFERKSVRAIASEVGKSKTWVADTLKRLGALNPSLGPSKTPHIAAGDDGNRWTLPEAMAHARRTIETLLARAQGDMGHVALASGKLFSPASRQLSEEEMEQLDSLPPLARVEKLLPPGRSLAEAIAGFIRVSPRSILDSNRWLAEALVDLLEAAHFGICEHRIPALLPRDNRKQAAATARKALRLLCAGNPGNPSGLPAYELAGVVEIIQLALGPLQQAWRKTDLEPIRARLLNIRSTFAAEVEGFKDAELQALLTEKLLTASARLASRETGIGYKSYLRACRQWP
jgi:hypothetical protein